MTEAFPIFPGAEAWSSAGSAPNAETGVLVVHGFTGNPTSVRPLGEALAAKGFKVELPRLPGHGTHYKDLAKTGYADWYAEVERAFQKLARSSRRVVVIGFSMGGTLGLDLTSQHAEIAGLVTINGLILQREGFLPKVAPLVEKFVSFVPASAAGLVKDDVAKPGQTESAYEKVPTKSANSILKALPEVRARLDRIRCPVLVAYSRNDHSVAPQNSQALPEMLRSAQVSQLVLERSYHLALLDYDFELLVDAIVAFIGKVAPNA